MKTANRRIHIVLLALLIVTFCAVTPARALKIIYPENNAQINAYSAFFIGNTQSDASLKINNEKVKVYPDGGFVHVVNLNPGANQVTIESYSPTVKRKLTYTVNAPEYAKTIPPYPLLIKQTSVLPNKSVVYKAGDLLQVSFMGSTGNKAYFSIGKDRQNIPMIEQPPKYIRKEPVYGKSVVSSQAPVKGVYKGTYKIQEKDVFNKEPIVIQLVSDKGKISHTAPVTVSTIPPDFPPIMALISTNYATVRTSPEQSRLTPLPEGTMLNLTGKIGNDYRFKMGEMQEGWISEKDVSVLPPGTPISESSIELLNMSSDEKNIYIKLLLPQKNPIIIEQPSENEMYLKIFGVKADVDLFSYKNADKFIKEIKLNQETKDAVKINIKAAARQFWGYRYYYEGDTLVLELKKPPVINADNPLKNINICIDPGHGGKEKGVVGPTGIPEKQVNLEIANKLKTLLEKKGANVIMTRTIDEDVEIYDRVKFANNKDAQIFLSIHNNSLPDGRNPYQEHGTSTYYYHSQSLPMAKILHKALLEDVMFNDFGIFWDSLVVTRPQEFLSVLLETGFMINPDEYALLTKPEFQDKIAASIVRGLEYFMFVNSEAANKENSGKKG
ncbi:MAG: hypothetical protein A2Y25_04110 [Candidatus Melainabacteria bacterium GWF2_37_15]|nr:MAG: hypothetical protein A2Y25_04110 [Candidatus Melainabacteria bacterium GWF2_37_15]